MTTALRTSVTDILRACRLHGIRPAVAGESLRVTPPGAAPEWLREELRSQKAAIIQRFTPPAPVLDRLCRWQGYLTTMNEQLEGLPDMGVGSLLEERYVRNLAAWAYQEGLWRPEWADCVHGSSGACALSAPVICQACISGHSGAALEVRA